ncbi:MAG: DMT family transporter [Rhodospirillaceae bacterium]|jgi:drug/metabolite transporter (DMT)-like permease|nr:DMT family transporter [Rhodospirillaceae bacterium]MBT7953685.1 DMT family transporter [Rhodospirillaceae bacterium]
MLTNQRTFGIVLALISAVNFALANTLAGVAYNGGSDPITMLATRFILAAILLFFMLKSAGKPVLMKGRANLAGIALGLLTVIYTFALLSAINLLPVSIAILLFYLFPILTAFILAALGWGKLTPTMVISAIIAFLGLALALAVKFDELDKVGIIYGLISAIGFAIVCSISNRIMRGQDSLLGTFYICAVATLTMIIVSFAVREFNLPTTGAGWAGFLASHILYTAAIIGFFKSVSMVGAAATTFFSNLEPIVVVGAGYVLLGQLISFWQMVGVAIVVGAIIYASRSGSDDTVSEAAE